MKSKIVIKFDETSLSASDRPPGGLNADAFEWALHQINFDRDIKYSHIKELALSSRQFSKTEIDSLYFINGVERAAVQALKDNKHLRGIILWNS